MVRPRRGGGGQRSGGGLPAALPVPTDGSCETPAGCRAGGRRSDEDYRGTHQPGWARDAAAPGRAATDARLPRGVMRATDDPWHWEWPQGLVGSSHSPRRVRVQARTQQRPHLGVWRPHAALGRLPGRGGQLPTATATGSLCNPPGQRVACGSGAAGSPTRGSHSADVLLVVVVARSAYGRLRVDTGRLRTRGGWAHGRQVGEPVSYQGRPTRPAPLLAPLFVRVSRRRGACGQGKGGRRPARNRRMTVNVHA